MDTGNVRLIPISKGVQQDKNIETMYLVAQTKEEQASSLQEVEWRGRRMAVRQEKVRRFLLSHQESDSELERAEDAEARCQVYESLLLECKDALQALKEELVEDPEFRARQQV